MQRLQSVCWDAPSALEANQLVAGKWRMTNIKFKQKFGKHVGIREETQFCSNFLGAMREYYAENEKENPEVGHMKCS